MINLTHKCTITYINNSTKTYIYIVLSYKINNAFKVIWIRIYFLGIEPMGFVLLTQYSINCGTMLSTAPSISHSELLAFRYFSSRYTLHIQEKKEITFSNFTPSGETYPLNHQIQALSTNELYHALS